MKPISKLHFITTNAAAAEQACQGGVDWIQLRLKGVSYDEYFSIGKDVQAVCKRYNATFIINDDIKLALDLEADGVHVGKEDPLPQVYIDAMLNRDGIIGCTANTLEDLVHLSSKPISYIGFGPYRYTATKKVLSPILGIEGYKKIFKEITEMNLLIPPIIGIGGILTDDVALLLNTRLHGIAVSGAISGAPSITSAAKNFIEQINIIKN